MLKKNQYDTLDLAKWICALLIIIIHTAPFEKLTIANFYITNVLARIAVPLFFAISGFLFFRNITFENGKIKRSSDNMNRLLKYVKHLSVIYLAASAFYLLYKIPYWYSIDWWGLHAVKDYLVNFFLSGSEYHLWYILASIYGMILLYIILSFVRLDTVKYLCVVGWIIECLLYSYSWVGIENISVLNLLTSHFSVCFDAAFRAIPLMAVGLLCTNNYAEKVTIFPPMLSFAAVALEASLLFFLSPNDGRYSYLLTTPLFTYFMLRWLLSVDFRFKNRGIPKFMRDTSLIIYVIHPMVIYLLDLTCISGGILRWLAVTAVSVAISYILLFLRSRFHPLFL